VSVPTGLPPPPEPTRLELLARGVGVAPDELRELLRDLIAERREQLEDAWRAQLERTLREALAEGASVAPAADESETTPGPHQQRI